MLVHISAFYKKNSSVLVFYLSADKVYVVFVSSCIVLLSLHIVFACSIQPKTAASQIWDYLLIPYLI